MLTKICTSCGKELPASTEYFHKNPKGKFGLQQKCKSCRAWSNPDNTEKEAQRKYSKKYYAKNKNNIIKKLTEWKANNPEKYRETVRQEHSGKIEQDVKLDFSGLTTEQLLKLAERLN